MDKPHKKFCVPHDCDDDDSLKEGPRCFEPGTLVTKCPKNAETFSTDPSPISDTIDVKLAPEFSSKTTENSEHVLASSSKEPSSKFQSEFGHLRESKFYEKPDESCQSKPGKATNFSALLVNPRQRGNPLLKHIRNVPWEFSEIEPDYIMGRSTCALFLSLRYHNLFPNYIHERLKALGKSFQLRVLLVQVDVAEPNPPLKDLSVISILADCTLMVSWSADEAGSYLETYKIFENKSADLIKEKQDSDMYSQLIDCLTTIRSINKTDAMVLLSNFKTLKGIINASISDLSQCPGLGPLKAKRLYDALRKPLKNMSRS